MPENLYCRLYIKSTDDEETLRKKIAGYFGGEISIRSVNDEFINLFLSKNDTYSPTVMNEHGGFVYYPYTAEVNARHEIIDDIEPVDSDIFLDILCHLITEMRKSGDSIVASCDYENLIAEKTGWNWSELTPDHPSIS